MTGEKARRIISGYGLEIKDERLFRDEQFPGPVTVKVREDWFDRRGQLAREIEKEEIVLWARGEHDGIRISFKENTPAKKIKGLIGRYEMLTLIEEDQVVNIRVMLVGVPKGEERKWIEIFKRENIVEYAELNNILRINSIN